MFRMADRNTLDKGIAMKLGRFSPSLTPLLASALLMALAAPALAQRPPEVCSPTNCLPPAEKKYKSGNQQIAEAHQRWGMNIFRKPSHKRFTGWDAPPPPGPPQPHVFGSIVEGLLSMDGGTTFTEVSLPATVTVLVQSNGMELDAIVGPRVVYATEMVQLDITGGGGILIRESPTLPSLGETTVRAIPGGFAISSFFDIFTELSLDGGATWIPSTTPGGVPLPARVVLADDDGPPLPVSTDAAPPPNVPYCQPTTNWPVKFGPNIAARNFKHRNLPNSINPPALGQTAFYSANNTLIEAELSTDGGATFNAGSALAQMAVRIHHTVDAGPHRYFDTEMLQLNLSGGSLPPGVLLRASPTLPSTGEHIIRQAGPTGLTVGSYFDVFLELSVDNGITWAPASGPVHMTLPAPGTIAPIPTLSQWGLILLGLLLLAAGTIVLRRWQPALQAAMPGMAGPRPGDTRLFVPERFLRVLAVTLGVAVLGLAGVIVWSGGVAARDIAGALLSAGIVAYWLHLLPRTQQE
jgi:hypothetical protein